LTHARSTSGLGSDHLPRSSFNPTTKFDTAAERLGTACPNNAGVPRRASHRGSTERCRAGEGLWVCLDANSVQHPKRKSRRTCSYLQSARRNSTARPVRRLRSTADVACSVTRAGAPLRFQASSGPGTRQGRPFGPPSAGPDGLGDPSLWAASARPRGPAGLD
jgi:hypothetical protein